MRRILTYGTFDLLHLGHIRLLERAKKEGDYLIVALSTDAFNEIKGKDAYHDFEERKQMLQALRVVDMVIPENTWDQKRIDVVKYHVDMVVMGDDWTGKFDDLSDLCEVKYLARTKGVSTTKIKNELGR